MKHKTHANAKHHAPHPRKHETEPEPEAPNEEQGGVAVADEPEPEKLAEVNPPKKTPKEDPRYPGK